MPSLQRRFNSTGRQRITRDRVSLVLEQPAEIFDAPSATATVNLADLELPPDAIVTLEAYYRSSAMRFPCGTVEGLVVPERMRLTEIDRGGAVKFRLLVTAPDQSGKILASADGLRPAKQDDSTDKQPLLPVRETDLGTELWNVDVDIRTGPTLLINNRVPGLMTRVRSSPLLQGAILPHALRIILQSLTAAGEEEGDDLWGDDWRKFLTQMGVPVEPDDPEDTDSCDEWIGTAVSAFCDLKDFPARIQLSQQTDEVPYA